MATYEVQFATSAAKEFRSLPPELKHRASAAIDGLNLRQSCGADQSITFFDYDTEVVFVLLLAQGFDPFALP